MGSEAQDTKDTARSRAESHGLAWMFHDCGRNRHGPRRIEPRRLVISMEVGNGRLPPRFWNRYYDSLHSR